MGNHEVWLKWVRELMAVSQAGLHYNQSPYEQERYAAVGRIAAEILAQASSLDLTECLELQTREFGYATPKVDVRGVVFQGDRVLLVGENADGGRWTLPGGWADVNETPRAAVEREVREESGFEVRAEKLLAVYDRHKQGHSPAFPFTVYKLFFQCRILSGTPTLSHEIGAVDFFSRDALPQLSRSRVNEQELNRFFDHLQHPEWPTDFD